MLVSTALRKARESKGLSQSDVGATCFLSNKTISAIERGRRRVPKDVSPKLATLLDDPELYAAVQSAATGGIASPWLNGPKVDLHRVSVKVKTVEELQEAVEALRNARTIINAKSAEELCDDGMQQVINALNELVEAQTACQVAVGVLCRTYGISMAQLYRQHLQELQAKGYVRKEEVA